MAGPIAFTALYLVAAGLGAIWRGNREFVIYILVMLVVIGGLAILNRRVMLTAALLWALSLWGLLHMAGGLAHVPESWPHHGANVLYNLWLVPGRLKFDQFVHAYGFGVTTWVCWHVVKTSLRTTTGSAPQPSFGLLVLCGAASMGFGALNEVIEFAASLTLPETNVGGYQNTGWDLVANLAGALVAAVAIRCFEHPSAALRARMANQCPPPAPSE
jgi:uncharacterized membrane protein YjdF